MANLTEQQFYDAAVYELATTDPVLGGPGGVDNQPHQQLTNRTAWLKQQVDALLAAGGSMADIVAAINAHLATVDPHQQYTTNAEVLALIVANAPAIPTGAIMYFPASVAPTGFLKLSGTVLSRDSYANLYAYAVASGNITDEATWSTSQWGSFSTGDLSTTFRIPDARGEFIRAWDDARGVDVNRLLGSWQADDFKSHRHNVTGYSLTGGGSPALPYMVGHSATTVGVSQGLAGGTETRPRSIAELACIKY